MFPIRKEILCQLIIFSLSALYPLRMPRICLRCMSQVTVYSLDLSGPYFQL